MVHYQQQQWEKQATAKRPVAARRQKDIQGNKSANTSQSKHLKTGRTLGVKARTPVIAETRTNISSLEMARTQSKAGTTASAE
jgi:hypothetical protein